MACKVRLYFYDSNSRKNIFDEGCHLQINGVNAEGETEQTNTELVFSHLDSFPGGDGYEFEKWSFSQTGVSFTPTNTETLTQNVAEVPYLEVRCCLKPKNSTITYNLNNGQANQKQTVLFNDPLVKLIDAPSKSKSVFAGWKVTESVPGAASITGEYAEGTAYSKYDKFWKNDYSGTKIYYQVTGDVAAEDNDGWDAMENRVFRLGANGEVLYAALSSYTPRALAITMTAEWKSMTDDSGTLYPAGEIIYEDEDGNVIGREQVDGGVAVKVNDGKDFKGIAFDEWTDESGKKVKKGSTIKTPTSGGGGGGGWSMRFHVSMAVNKEFWVRYDARGGKVQPEPQGPFKAVKDGENPPTTTVAALPKKKGTKPDEEIVAKCWLSGGSAYMSGDVVVVDRDITFVADYSNHEKVTVTFTSTGGGDVQAVIDPADKQKEFNLGDTYTFPVVKDTSGNPLTVLKWTTGKDNKQVGGPDGAGAEKVRNPNGHTVTAHLIPMKPITLMPNGSGASITMDTGGTYTTAHKVRVNINSDKSGTGEIPGATASRGTDYNDKDYKCDANKKVIWYLSSSPTAKDVYNPADKKNANTNPVTAYVKWAQIVEFNPNKGDPYTKTADDHGYFAGEKYGHLPDDKVMTRENYHFIGWFTSASGGELVHKDSIVTNSARRTLYAHWERSVQVVWFDAGEGKCEYEPPNNKRTYGMGDGKKYGVLPKATRETSSQGAVYEFEGWHDHSYGDQRKVDENSEVTDSAERTLTAHYTLKTNKLVQFNTGDKGYFSGGYDGMHWHESVYFKVGVPYKEGKINDDGTVMEDYTFPQATGLDVWKFVGWYTDPVSGMKVEETEVPDDSSTLQLYAHYEDTRVECTVTYDSNGGILYTQDKIVMSGNPAGALPLLKNPNPKLTHVGWHQQTAVFAVSKRDGGDVTGPLVTATTIINGDMTIKAAWAEKIFLYYAVSPQGN